MPKPELEKNLKIENQSNPILNYREDFAKKKDVIWPNFHQNFLSNHHTRELDEFWANFLKSEKLKLEKFWNFETWKTQTPQTQTPKGQLNSNPKKSKLDQALITTDLGRKFKTVIMYKNRWSLYFLWDAIPIHL